MFLYHQRKELEEKKIQHTKMYILILIRLNERRLELLKLVVFSHLRYIFFNFMSGNYSLKIHYFRF